VKRLFLLIILMPTVLWAQENFNLPIVPPEESVSVSKPDSPFVLPLVLPTVPTQDMASLTRPEVPSFSPLSLPQAESQSLEVGTHQFGGLNLFMPTNKVPKEQAIVLNNFLPKGFVSLEKRVGIQKANPNDSTLLSGVYGMAMGGATPQIIASTAESLCYALLSADLNFVGIDTTSAILTYFASTPFGVIVMNGTDSTRIWIDRDTIEALGVIDTGTFDADSTVGGDTSWVADSSAAWTADEWIGYWLKCSSSYLEIIDNGNNWFHVKLCGDTCDAETTFLLLARPDSVGSTLGYPIGKAGAYYGDRFFVNSEWLNNRIYFSKVHDPDDIPPENFINLDMGRHDEIVAMRVFNGYLIVFGKYSIYGINASCVATPITKSLGCVSPNAIAMGDNYIYFPAQDGIYRFSSNIYGSMSYKPEKISYEIDEYLKNIDPSYLDYCAGVCYNNQYWFSYDRDKTLVFDEGTKQWYPLGFGFGNALVTPPEYSRYELILPNADGTTTDWDETGAGSDHYAQIDETHTGPDDANYVSTAVSSENEQFAFANIVDMPTGASIKSVILYLRARGSLFEQRIIVGIKSGSIYPVDTLNTSIWWTNYVISMNTNPADNQAWERSDIDALEINLRSLTSATKSVYVSQLEAGALFQGDASSNLLFSGLDKPFLYQYGGVFDDDTSSAFGEVYGEPVIATMQSGFFDNDLPVDDKLLRQFYLQTESDSGDIWVYYYTDYGTTPSDSDLVHLGGKRTSWWMLGEKVKGKNFSIEIENKSNVDSLIIKGWSAILNNLGHRGGE